MPAPLPQPYYNAKRSNFYYAWSNMRRRCNEPDNKDARNYSERGIGYDPRWDSFKKFTDDMFNGYIKGLSLDRIDNSKGYSKSNCRWATQKTQCNNKRNNRNITMHGITKNFTQWCELYNVRGSKSKSRYYCYGWSIEETLGLKPRKIG